MQSAADHPVPPTRPEVFAFRIAHWVSAKLIPLEARSVPAEIPEGAGDFVGGRPA